MENNNKIDERAETYSFNMESKLFNLLSPELQYIWKEEIEQAYKAGAIGMLDSPTGKELLYVCNKSYERGKNDILNALEAVLKVLKRECNVK